MFDKKAEEKFCSDFISAINILGYNLSIDSLMKMSMNEVEQHHRIMTDIAKRMKSQRDKVEKRRGNISSNKNIEPNDNEERVIKRPKMRGK